MTSYGLVLETNWIDLVVPLNSSLRTSNEENNKISKRKITRGFNVYINYIMRTLSPVWNLGKIREKKGKCEKISKEISPSFGFVMKWKGNP